jgi:putative membrane protein
MDQKSTTGRQFPSPVLNNNVAKKARISIWGISIIVFIAIAMLSKITVAPPGGFDPHIFATLNAVINSIVAVVLIAALMAVKSKLYFLHRNLMLLAIGLSVLFLISYVCHHLMAGDTRFGDLNHDGIVSADEKALAGSRRYVYYFILMTHIPLAAIILPFILFTAFNALSGDYSKHKKLARITWPIWFYVAISGVAVYLLIRPYY